MLFVIRVIFIYESWNTFVNCKTCLRFVWHLFVNFNTNLNPYDEAKFSYVFVLHDYFPNHILAIFPKGVNPDRINWT